MRFTLTVALAVAMVAATAAADTLTGRARVLDGDTVAVGGVTVRLKGIAAPELDEPGGDAARALLVNLAQGKTLVCDLARERTHSRRVGICRLDGLDVAEQSVAASLPLPDYCRARR